MPLALTLAYSILGQHTALSGLCIHILTQVYHRQALSTGIGVG